MRASVISFPNHLQTNITRRVAEQQRVYGGPARPRASFASSFKLPVEGFRTDRCHECVMKSPTCLAQGAARVSCQGGRVPVDRRRPPQPPPEIRRRKARTPYARRARVIMEIYAVCWPRFRQRNREHLHFMLLSRSPPEAR